MLNQTEELPGSLADVIRRLRPKANFWPSGVEAATEALRKADQKSYDSRSLLADCLLLVFDDPKQSRKAAATAYVICLDNPHLDPPARIGALFHLTEPAGAAVAPSAGNNVVFLHQFAAKFRTRPPAGP
jgi:hypothetical protein